MLMGIPFFSLGTNIDGGHVNDPIYLPELPCAQNLLFFQFVERGACLENPRDGEAWWAAVYGVIQSRTRLTRLSSNSSSSSSDVYRHSSQVRYP